MRKLMVSFGVSVGLLLVLCGCGAKTVTFSLQNESVTSSTDSVVFNSSQPVVDNQEKEVAEKLTAFVNSGKHNITEVDLTYTDQYLTSATVYYITNTSGAGNNLRLKLIRSSQNFCENIQPDIQKQITQFTASGIKVKEVMRIQQEDCLVAAAVWYWAS